ncbi:hypothetical protein amb2805 [Paramagnetospirillum magneticum AMB-1]|uniref:Uncharacterized protein n=1 Tax=Paramagnetospirillum magneticum (strain ATCC 700264 / AMB-1) TaxID=342108 RepID=Q2W3G6_PARM1|nr:hypothetical protein amb2805 [Paramagnetospirillum magneticum AMB-1]
MARLGPGETEGRRRKAPAQRIPRPANDNFHPDARRHAMIAVAALALSALALLALTVSGWR